MNSNEIDGKEEFEVDAALEAVLLESIEQGHRGETIPADELLREIAQPRMTTSCHHRQHSGEDARVPAVETTALLPKH